MYELIDKLPAWALLGMTAAILTLASALGHRLGRLAERDGDSGGNPHASALVGALVGLLGLLLAFSYGAVDRRFAARKQLVVDDANAIGTTFLRAGMLDVEQRDAVRSGLSEYVDLRLGGRTPRDIEVAIARSEEIQRSLWRQGEDAAERHPQSVIVGLFVSALNELIDLHETRVTVGIYQRLSLATLAILLAMAVLSIGVVGYIGGAARSRARFPEVGFILAVSFVMTLIMDLDRPSGRLFHVDQHAMRDVRAMIDAYEKTAPSTSRR